MNDLLNEYRAIIRSFTIKEYDVMGDRCTLRLQITFVDGSRLMAYESLFYDTQRAKYSYQWMTDTNQFIHRWDNAHPVSLPTSPHHQHIGSEENVVASEPMTLEMVLTSIASQLISS